MSKKSLSQTKKEIEQSLKGFLDVNNDGIVNKNDFNKFLVDTFDLNNDGVVSISEIIEKVGLLGLTLRKFIK